MYLVACLEDGNPADSIQTPWLSVPVSQQVWLLYVFLKALSRYLLCMFCAIVTKKNKQAIPVGYNVFLEKH